MKPLVKSGYIEGEKVSWVGMLVTIGLIALKLSAGIIGRSQAMIADGIESIGDLLVSGITLVSMRISRKPVDESHPYGHGKAEVLAAGLIGFIIVAAGLLIVFSAGRSILLGRLAVPGIIALVAVVITIIVKEAMYQYVYSVGKRLNSPAVIASAWDHRKDALTSIATLIGIAGARLGLTVLDPVAALFVTVFIFRVGYMIIKDSFSGLLDAAVAPDILMRVWRIAERVPGVEHVNDVRGRNMGQYLVVDIKLQVDADTTVESGHAVATEVKNRVMNETELVADVMVHVNPHARHT